MLSSLIEAGVHSGSLRWPIKPGIAVDTDDVTLRSGTVKVEAPGVLGAGREWILTDRRLLLCR